MSIYIVRLNEWYPKDDPQYEAAKCAVRFLYCEWCGKDGKKVNYKYVYGHHSLPQGHGDLYCTRKCLKKAHNKTQYNMTLEQVDEFKKVRNNTCDICNVSYNKMNIDHCHKTNIVRGLLCSNCNRALGLLKDSKDVLMNAYKYLIRTQK